MLQWTLSMHLEGEVPSALRRADAPNVRVGARARPGGDRASVSLGLFADYWTYAFSQEWPEVEAQPALVARGSGTAALERRDRARC